MPPGNASDFVRNRSFVDSLANEQRMIECLQDPERCRQDLESFQRFNLLGVGENATTHEGHDASRSNDLPQGSTITPKMVFIFVGIGCSIIALILILVGFLLCGGGTAPGHGGRTSFKASKSTKAGKSTKIGKSTKAGKSSKSNKGKLSGKLNSKVSGKGGKSSKSKSTKSAK